MIINKTGAILGSIILFGYLFLRFVLSKWINNQTSKLGIDGSVEKKMSEKERRKWIEREAKEAGYG